MRIKVTIISIIFLVYFGPHVFGKDSKQLTPRSVVIQSTFIETARIPAFDRHTYDDTQNPGLINDPFSPKFKLRDPKLPEGFTINTKLDGGMFRGREGEIAMGIRAFLKRDFTVAKQIFQSMLSVTDEFTELAVLWLARVSYTENKFKDSTQYFARLHQADDIDVQRDAIYYTSLILVKSQKFKENIDFMNSITSSLKKDHWDIRLGYSYLISLVSLERWPEAKEYLKYFENSGISHSDQYYKVKETGGIIYFALDDLKRSRNYFADARDYHQSTDYFHERSRNLAWIAYLSGRIDQALEILQRDLAYYHGNFQEELKYLKLTCLVRKKDWIKVEQILSKIPKKINLLYIFGLSN